MADRLAQAADFIWRTQPRVPIVFESDGRLIEVEAIPGQSTHQAFDADGIEITTASDDFIVRAADLVHQGQRIIPTRGDVVHYAGVERRLLPIENDRAFRQTDQTGKLLRVYTKRVSNGDT